MSVHCHVAAVQMVSSDVLADNLARVEALVRRAVDEGAKLVVLPENFALMGKRQSDIKGIAERDGDGPIQDFLSRLARRSGVWLVAGTLPLAAPDGRVYAASLVFDDHGQQRARYDKIHLYDVNVPDSDEHYCESSSIHPGDQVKVVDSPVGRLGLSVCYDLRFPELYRSLQRQGAEVLLVPSAFTAKTGAAHWMVLLRARAIENLCFVIAPNQGGRHANGRSTYGHSSVIDPWGTPLATATEGEAVICASLDLGELHHKRRQFPVLQHQRMKTTET